MRRLRYGVCSEDLERQNEAKEVVVRISSEHSFEMGVAFGAAVAVAADVVVVGVVR